LLREDGIREGMWGKKKRGWITRAHELTQGWRKGYIRKRKRLKSPVDAPLRYRKMRQDEKNSLNGKGTILVLPGKFHIHQHKKEKRKETAI